MSSFKSTSFASGENVKRLYYSQATVSEMIHVYMVAGLFLKLENILL